MHGSVNGAYDATWISNARLVCGDLIVAEKDATLTKWVASAAFSSPDKCF